MPMETMVLFGLLIFGGFYLAWNMGANDVSNAIGTSVGSGALTMRRAVMIAAVFEFCGAFFFGSHVSQTIQNGIIDTSYFTIDPNVLVYGMLASLLAAGTWLQLASYCGWPVSTTHSIIGAVVGFGAVVGGMDAIHWNNVSYIGISWVLSPLFGGVLSYTIFTTMRNRIFYDPHPFEAAKKLTPILVFFFFGIFALILVFNGLSNLNLHLSFLEATGVSLLAGNAAALISFLLLRRLKLPTADQTTKPIENDPSIAASLEKARYHLAKVRSSAHGEMQDQLTLLLTEIESMNDALEEKEKPKQNIHIQYTAIEGIFAKLQILSACVMAFSHGANDVANAIGPLSAAVSVLQTGSISPHAAIPTWALALGGVGIVAGLAMWGWRVIETIGKKITKLTPTRGFAAEFGAAATIAVASRLGMPISTTHTLVGSVLGVGLARGIEALNLNTARDIALSWMVTIPAGAILSIVFFYIINFIFSF